MIDIFNAPKSVIANGLEGKIILVYGRNSLGKTDQATKLPKPLVLACEMGMNGISGIPYIAISRWSDFKNTVRQLTSPATIDKAKEMYSTIIVDEVYASSIYCQDYVCSTFGDGAQTLADGDTKHNLYQLYEKEYFRQITQLTNSGYTVVFIAHEKEDPNTHFITPKGDKRSIDPIIDRCDYVVYLKSNGVDADGKVIKSSAYLAETDKFFARSRIEHTPTFIKEFTAENLVAAIQKGIDKKAELENATVVTYTEQAKQNAVKELDYDELMNRFKAVIDSLISRYDDVTFKNQWAPKITEITEKYLGKGKKVSQCTRGQEEVLSLIVSELEEFGEK